MAGAGIVSPALTLAEIEVALRKAARAAGYPWGLAEEAGKAARWLAAYGLPGAELTLARLREHDGDSLAAVTPDCARSPWRAGGGGALCPIVAGAALGDRVSRLLAGEVIELADCAHPLLLAPALGQAAFQLGESFGLAWDEVEIGCFPDGMAVLGGEQALLAERAARVLCRARPLIRAAPRPPSTAARAVDARACAAIDALARQTYVPASAASRDGAGSALSDND